MHPWIRDIGHVILLCAVFAYHLLRKHSVCTYTYLPRNAGFGTVEHAIHAKRRAALSPLFSSRAIASTDGIMQQQVQILSDAFQKKFLSKEVVQLRSIFVAFTTDTIYQYAMGHNMGMQRDEERARQWLMTLEETSKVTPMAKQFTWMLALAQKIPLEWIRWLKPEVAVLLEIQHVSRLMIEVFR